MRIGLLLGLTALAACGGNTSQKLELTEFPAGTERDRLIVTVAKGAWTGFEQGVFGDMSQLKVWVAELDVQGDTTPEKIIKVEHPTTCNTYGCYFAILTQTGPEPEMYLSTTGFDLYYAPKKDEHNLRTLYLSRTEGYLKLAPTQGEYGWGHEMFNVETRQD